MENVFITQSNAENLIKLFNFNYNYEDLICNDKLIKLLSTPELKYLLEYKYILEGRGEIPIYEKDSTNKFKNNTKRMIYEGGKPSFHLEKNCSFLISSYENFVIPVEIKDRDIDEYRKFFINEINLFKEKPDVFYAKVGLKFAVNINNVERFSAKNSGVKPIDNIELTDPEEITIKVKDHISKMELYSNSSPEHESLITRYGFGSHKTKEQFPIIKEWHDYKATLKNLIKSYLVSKFNPDFEFDISVLEQCGYKLCKTCSFKANLGILK